MVEIAGVLFIATGAAFVLVGIELQQLKRSVLFWETATRLLLKLDREMLDAAEDIIGPERTAATLKRGQEAADAASVD